MITPQLSISAPFRYEREMAGPLYGILEECFQPQDFRPMRVACEVAIGSLIPDMLLGVSESVAISTHRLSYLEASVLSTIELRNCNNLAELREHLYLTPSAESRVLRQLQKIGALHLTESQFTIAQNWISERMQITAFEFKLKRWREALSQALSYLAFANQSYVILDAAQTNTTSEMLELFSASGVGLGLFEGGSVSVVVKAESHCPISPARQYAIQAIATSPGVSQTFA